LHITHYIPFGREEVFSLLLIFLITFGGTYFSRVNRIYDKDAITATEPVELIIHEEKKLDYIFEIEQIKPLVNDEEEFKWVARILGWRTFSPGRYVFEGSYSYEVFLSKLSRGIQDPLSFTIIPGTTLESLAEQTGRLFKFSESDFKGVFHDSLFLEEAGGFTKEKLFGRMLPETYKVYWSVSPDNLIKRVLAEFDKNVVSEYNTVIAESGLTVDEIITLASIIEWEANNDNEKPRISGLYWNRLTRGIPLQADPTVNYALGERRRLLFEDYKTDHPFNTYLYKGLPPGPITNPSLSSIKAAIYPEKHDYLYMVANSEGGHTFSRTFEEHQRESAKWRNWIREQYRIKREKELQENSSIN